MKIYERLDNFPKLNFPVVTSGTFDGVHLGHQRILERLQEIARRSGGETVVITYWPHPRLVLQHDAELKLLNTFEEKARLLEEAGVDYLLKLPFTKTFASQSSQEYIKNILVHGIHTRKLVIGYNHRFGRNREGSFEHLKATSQNYGFEVEEIPRQEVEDVAVSSTKIRNALDSGRVEAAAKYLGRPYEMSGEVIKGNQLGHSLGFPTANLSLPMAQKLIPADGIYAVEVKVGSKFYKGMLYIGDRTSLDQPSRSIEVNIFDFNSNIYGEQITLVYRAYLRGEMTFSSMEALSKQLEKDRELAKQVLNV